MGAKDILVDGAGIVIEDIEAEKLCEIFQGLTRQKLELMNKVIVESQPIMRMEDMSRQTRKKSVVAVETCKGKT
ncbi:MAG: hypothetical protein ACLTS6_00510 [Anaerobutyricum sp.]